MLSLVAVLSGEDIFLNFYDGERRAEALTAHAKFENKHGDHLTLLNVYKAFSKNDKVKVWCHENYLNNRNLTYALDVRKQLSEICHRLDLEFSSCGNNFDQVNNNTAPIQSELPIMFFSVLLQVRKCLLTGLFINVAEAVHDNHYLPVASRHKARIHPSSVLSGKPRAKFILFTELVSTGKTYMRTVTDIEPEWLDEIVPNFGQVKKLFNMSNGS